MWCRNCIAYLFIYNLFNIAVSNIGCIVSNDCMSVNNELQRILQESSLVLIQSIVEIYAWMDREKHKTSVMILIFPAKIWAWHLQNIIQEHCTWTTLLSDIWFWKYFGCPLKLVKFANLKNNFNLYGLA
jgi:hypothetical protein